MLRPEFVPNREQYILVTTTNHGKI